VKTAPAGRPAENAESEAPVRIGVSACLLGQQVRFDGGHKRDAFLIGTFGKFVEWVPVCPEVEMGLGTPRETLRLERRAGAIHFVMPKSGIDHTEGMRTYAERRVRELEKEELSGYVLKKDSPSCGMERVRLYDLSSVPARTGRGLFAEALLRHFPDLPVEEEGRLGDMKLRENFVQRVFAYHRLKAFFALRFSLGGLVIFHTAHKLLLMSHSPAAYQHLGRLVAGAKDVPREELRARYRQELMSALSVVATTRRHVNVLQHMLGYFSRDLEDGAREELVGLIEDYRKGVVPLVVPLTLIRHHVRRLSVPYLRGQIYLEPHPRELMLLNHV
jgi:uncharacterized protein YbgA (DUF1722 family)/uncharacterized protein YbbK (DUF523 family)